MMVVSQARRSNRKGLIMVARSRDASRLMPRSHRKRRRASIQSQRIDALTLRSCKAGACRVHTESGGAPPYKVNI